MWGGESDTAGALRGTCTHALRSRDLRCRPADGVVEPLTHTDKTVRMEAARATVGGVSAALLMRLRARRWQDEPEVLGVYSALLEGGGAIPLVCP